MQNFKFEKKNSSATVIFQNSNIIISDNNEYFQSRIKFNQPHFYVFKIILTNRKLITIYI